MIRKAFGRAFLYFLVSLTAFLVACHRQGVTESRDANKGLSEVTVYVSTDRVFSEPILKAYERKTGVKVNAVYDTEETKSTGLANRLLAEKNNPQADVFWSNEPVRTLVLESRGALTPYNSPNAEGIPATFKDPEGYWTDFSARIRVIVYNTNLVKPQDAPKSIYDLADPKWRGQIAIADPRFGLLFARASFPLKRLLRIALVAPLAVPPYIDLYGTKLFNGRPGIPTDLNKPGLIRTSYGLLDPNPTADEKILPRNFGRGPGSITVNLRLSKSTDFGGARESAAATQRGSVGGGEGRPASGAFGAGAPPQGGPPTTQTGRRYNLTISMSIRNLLNHTNPGPIIGNITSTLFGQANQPSGGGGFVFSEAANNRRLELQMRFTF